jgi:hypothetical protein
MGTRNTLQGELYGGGGRPSVKHNIEVGWGVGVGVGGGGGRGGGWGWKGRGVGGS